MQKKLIVSIIDIQISYSSMLLCIPWINGCATGDVRGLVRNND